MEQSDEQGPSAESKTETELPEIHRTKRTAFTAILPIDENNFLSLRIVCGIGGLKKLHCHRRCTSGAEADSMCRLLCTRSFSRHFPLSFAPAWVSAPPTRLIDVASPGAPVQCALSQAAILRPGVYGCAYLRFIINISNMQNEIELNGYKYIRIIRHRRRRRTHTARPTYFLKTCATTATVTG